jgi:signal transduction histidine kinase
MSPNKKANLTLAIALILLCVSAIAATFTIVRLYNAEALVSHTYTVEVSLGDLESALADVGQHRVAYIDSGTAVALADFSASTARVEPALVRIRQLTGDNPMQLALCDRLEANARQRMAVSRDAVELRRQGQNDPRKQMQITSEIAKAALGTADISGEMRQNEDNLLARRNDISQFLFTAMIWIVLVSIASSALMFWIHYRLLNRELQERKAAEKHLLQLSGQLIRVQDDERKRFGRELHDGLGQNIVAAKMAAEVLLGQYPDDQRFQEMAALLDDALSQTRAISYLLHPPLLDEVGLTSATEWLIEGYTKRTGIEVSLKIPVQPKRLPRYVELTVFRILQEALTNIYRHSKSARAEVSIEVNSHEVTLVVRDYGKGIPIETLSNFNAHGTHVGIGLAGMKERIRQLGGKLEIKSNGAGTEVAVNIPMVSENELRTDTLVS